MTTEQACEIKYCEGQWYYREQPACVGHGGNAESCDNTRFTCAGGLKFGYGAEQRDKVVEAISNMDSGQEPNCPGSPPNTCSKLKLFAIFSVAIYFRIMTRTSSHKINILFLAFLKKCSC